MAPAQVLSNSGTSSVRKQGHLEAGKRRLEEFRKKKAEERARRVVSVSQLPRDGADLVDKSVHEPSTSGSKSALDSVATGDSSGLPVASKHRPANSSPDSEVGPSNGVDATIVDSVESSKDQMQSSFKDEESNSYRSSGSSGLVNGYKDHWQNKNNGSTGSLSELVSTRLHDTLDPVSTGSITNESINQLKGFSAIGAESDGHRNLKRDTNDSDLSSVLDSRTSLVNAANITNQLTAGIGSAVLSHNKFDVNNGSMDQNSHVGLNTKGRKISDSISRHLNIENAAWPTKLPSSTDYSSTSMSSFAQNSSPATILGSASGRTRSSFLDSISISRAPSNPNIPTKELVKPNPTLHLNINSANEEVHLISSSQMPSAHHDASESANFRNDNTNEQMELSSAKDDNFASLEQHIEDLTQEKFSLQRALDTSRSLAESLASENSSLTDSFNQQGKVINQLKLEMEKLQEEIQAQMLAFEALKMEYTNAQLECNAADERAKILASEVISLEEKALRLRSNELKLEKQLENSNADISSCKRKLHSLEKEHRDFQSTIEALQEEKKLLQSKLRKTSLYGNVVENNDMDVKKDACTSTEDLGIDEDLVESSLRNSSEELGSSSILPENTSSFPSQHNIHSSFPEGTATIPDDQLKMINNINSLISELALEKEELRLALVSESSISSKLKDLNKELSQKLEVQTQRFELLAAQKMANENVQTRFLDTQSIRDTAEYADEGDEVVERVLGWIMKLFPGGPAKRRTSKLL